MKRWIFIAVALCMILGLASCGLKELEPETVYNFIDGIAEEFGQSQLTKDTNLIGKRSASSDTYTGQYWADCGGSTGRDVVFGGASVKQRTLRVRGHINTESGQAWIRIRMNEEVTELQADQSGFFETELSCNSGGHYIMVCYDAFEGTVEMTSELKFDSSSSVDLQKGWAKWMPREFSIGGVIGSV